MERLNFFDKFFIRWALKKEGASLCYLFGSFARGEEHSESDVDIAVLFGKAVKKEEFLAKEGKLIGLFGKYFPGREINLVNLSAASPLLRQNTILEGKLLYASSEDERIMFQYDTLHQYEEYKHLSGIYNLVLGEKLKTI